MSTGSAAGKDGLKSRHEFLIEKSTPNGTAGAESEPIVWPLEYDPDDPYELWVIGKLAEVARREPEKRVSIVAGLMLSTVANPVGRAAVMQIRAELDQLQPDEFVINGEKRKLFSVEGIERAMNDDPDAEPDDDPDAEPHTPVKPNGKADFTDQDPYRNVPVELKEKHFWTLWKWEDRDGKKTKVPYRDLIFRAKSNDPSTFIEYDTALSNFRKNPGIGGIGCFAAGHGYVAADLDGARNPKTGEIADWARKLMEDHPSYCEVTPSGFGFRLIYRAAVMPTLPNGKRICQWEMSELPGIRDAGYDKAKTELEVFTGKKFIAITGNVYGSVLKIADYDAFVDTLPKKKPKPTVAGDAQIVKYDPSDTEKFKLLFAGKWEEVKEERPNGLKITLVQKYRSWSEADCGLCTLLAYKHGNDPDAIDEEFRQSEMYRETKWERDDYRENTIRAGIEWAATHPGNLTNFRYTDTGNAERLVARHGENFRYLHDEEKWVHYDGTRWNRDQMAEIHRAAKETVATMHKDAVLIEDDGMRQKYAQWVARSESRGTRDNMVALARMEREVSARSSEFDTDPMLLNVLNGTIDLRTFELRPHRREDLITKRCPVKFDPEAQCPRWLQFLREIFPGQPDTIEFLQRSVGYSLAGLTVEQCFWLLIGGGKNGKSSLLDAIQFLLGDYAVATSFDTFSAKKDSGGINPRDGMACLVGSRFVRASEADENKRISEAQIKALTGGERIRTAKMYQEDFDFKPTFKIWLSTNAVPVIRGTDEGIWRRVKRVNFKVEIPERDRDLQLGAKLEAEASGILNWALAGLRQYQATGLKVPEAVTEATAEYRAEQNLVGRFLAECTEKTSESVDATALYHEFKNWAKDNNEFPLSKTKFGLEAKKLLAAGRGNTGRVVYQGIKLKAGEPATVSPTSPESENCPF